MLDLPLHDFIDVWCFLEAKLSVMTRHSTSEWSYKFMCFYQTWLFGAMFFDPCFLQVWLAEDRLVWKQITNSNLCWRYFQYPFSYPPSNLVYDLDMLHTCFVSIQCVYNCVYISFSNPNLFSCTCWSHQVFILMVGCIPRSSKRAPARTWGGIRTNGSSVYEIFTKEIRTICKMDQHGVINTINT